MNRITEITKRDIFELFQKGLEACNWLQGTYFKHYNYYGRLTEITFLKRLYNLDKITSLDSRFENLEQEIVQSKKDSSCWVFKDRRFNLQKGSDEEYLKFLCEIFHPMVRDDDGYWRDFLEKINEFLENDGYEIYPAFKISNHDVYGWRIKESNSYIPYSQLKEEDIKSKKIVLKIPKKTRHQIYQTLEQYNTSYYTTNETGYNYPETISGDFFNTIKTFYTPKFFDDKGEYLETTDLESFICSNYPFRVLDAIEFFARHPVVLKEFETQMNAILKLNRMRFQLCSGKLIDTFDIRINEESIASIQEVGLKELLQESSRYYEEGNFQIAVEKLWDAFERLKTYYCSLDEKKDKDCKKKSAKKIVEDMSNSNQDFFRLFDNEFDQLTKIGNAFRIRHHEIGKTEIQDKRHYEYFYKRCLSLVSTSIQYLEGRDF